ncbi:MAG: hypothetical protein AB2L16_07900 [Anaerolineaceae bacterium]|jgi:hypothetical protein
MNILAPIGKLTHYLDPGTGSMVLQVVLAALLSVGVLLKVFWRKIRGWFNPHKTSVSDEIDPTEIAEAESAQLSPEDDLK